MVEEAAQEPTKKTNGVAPPRRYVYLAGPVELEGSWRERASKALREMGLEPLDPLRGEEHKAKGKHIVASVPDALLVMRDLNDMQRIKLSGGLCMMNLSTTEEGRKPLATIMELMWLWLNQVPVIGIMGRDCSPEYRNHPWIKYMSSYQATSVKDALDLIEEYFA